MAFTSAPEGRPLEVDRILNSFLYNSCCSYLKTCKGFWCHPLPPSPTPSLHQFASAPAPSNTHYARVCTSFSSWKAFSWCTPGCSLS